MDAQRLGFPDGSFDAVVAQFVITAVPDPEATLDEFARVTKPGERSSWPITSAPRPACSAALTLVCAARRRLGWRPEFEWARLARWAERHGGVRVHRTRDLPPLGLSH